MEKPLSLHHPTSPPSHTHPGKGLGIQSEISCPRWSTSLSAPSTISTRGWLVLRDSADLGSSLRLQLPHQAPVCRGGGPASAGVVSGLSAGRSRWGRNTPVGAGEGTWLLQLAMEIGTEASEQGEGRLIRAGPEKWKKTKGATVAPSRACRADKGCLRGRGTENMVTYTNPVPHLLSPPEHTQSSSPLLSRPLGTCTRKAVLPCPNWVRSPGSASPKAG